MMIVFFERVVLPICEVALWFYVIYRIFNIWDHVFGKEDKAVKSTPTTKAEKQNIKIIPMSKDKKIKHFPSAIITLMLVLLPTSVFAEAASSKIVSNNVTDLITNTESINLTQMQEVSYKVVQNSWKRCPTSDASYWVIESTKWLNDMKQKAQESADKAKGDCDDKADAFFVSARKYYNDHKPKNTNAETLLIGVVWYVISKDEGSHAVVVLGIKNGPESFEWRFYDPTKKDFIVLTKAQMESIHSKDGFVRF